MNRFASTPVRLSSRSTDVLRSPVHRWRRTATLAWALMTLLVSFPVDAPAAEPARSGGLWGRYIFTNRQTGTKSGETASNRPTSHSDISKTPTNPSAQLDSASVTPRSGNAGPRHQDSTNTSAPIVTPAQILSASSSRRVARPAVADSKATETKIAEDKVAEDKVAETRAPKSAVAEASVLKSHAASSAATQASVLKSSGDKSVEPDRATLPSQNRQASEAPKTFAAVPDYEVAGSRQAERQAALFSELLVPRAPQTSANANPPQSREETQLGVETAGPREFPTSNVTRASQPTTRSDSAASDKRVPVSVLSAGARPGSASPLDFAAASSESSRRAGRVPFQLQRRLTTETGPSAPVESVGQAVTVSRVTELDGDITTRRTLPLNRKLVANRTLAATAPDAVQQPSILLNTATASDSASESAVGLMPETPSNALPLFQDFAAAMASSEPSPMRTDISAGKSHLTLRRDLDERRQRRTQLNRQPRTIAAVTHEYQEEPGTLDLGPGALNPPSAPTQGEPLVPPANAEGGRPEAPSAELIPSGKPQLSEEDRKLWQQIEDYGRLRPIDDISLNIRPFSHRHLDEPSEAQELIKDPTMPGNPAALLMSNQDTIHYVTGPLRNPINAGALLSLADFCHRPLYFQEINLERYGTHHRFWQPALSAAHFFAVLPTLPYQMAIQRPCMCYHYRHPYQAGRPAPWERELPPLRLDASLLQAGVVMGIIILFP